MNTGSIQDCGGSNAVTTATPAPASTAISVVSSTQAVPVTMFTSAKPAGADKIVGAGLAIAAAGMAAAAVIFG